MVEDTGAAVGVSALPVNKPKPIAVETDKENRPIGVRMGQWVRVMSIQDRWRIDDEWWRAILSRVYYRVLLQSGRELTIYYDLINAKWYEQSY